MSNIDVLELLQLAREVAREAAALAADMRDGGVRVSATKSNDLDIVTRADTAVETLIRTRLSDARPSDFPLHKALISTGVPYDLQIRARVLADVSVLLPRVRDIRLVGSAALDICGVAEGRTDAHAGRRLPVWNYAAAGLIAAQAGAVIRGPRGGRPNFDLVLVAEERLADTFDPLLSNGEEL